MHRTLAILVAASAACYGGASGRLTSLEQRVATLEQAPKATPPAPTVRRRKRPVATDAMYGGRVYGGGTYGAATAELEALRSQLQDLERMHADTERRLDQMDETADLALLGGPVANLISAASSAGRPVAGVEYAVPVQGSATQGAATAPVTWVVGVELSEPYSVRMLATVSELRATFGDRLRVVYKHFVVHPQYAIPQALAWCAAARQGKLDAALAALVSYFTNGPRSNRVAQFRMARLRPQLAAAAGIDLKRFDKDVAGPCRAELQRDQALFASLGATGTPVSFINGHYYPGARAKDHFEKAINEALDRATADLGGKSARGYYDKIVKRGKTAP